MKVYEIAGYYNDDKTPFSRYLVADMNETPRGYSDDSIFYYGVTPQAGQIIDDITVTKVELYDEVS